MSEWVDVCGAEIVGEQKSVEVKFGGRAIAVVRVEGQVFAIDDACPHRGASLAAGDLDGHFLFCPLHAWSFDVRSGEAFFPKGARVACFQAKEENGRIWLKAA